MNIFNYIKIMLVYKNEKLLQYAKYKLKNIKKRICIILFQNYNCF
jgi:hypothetical protein